MRTFGIWLFGILASAIIGGVIGGVAGSRLDDIGTGELMIILGMLAGVFSFACIRLWLTSRIDTGEGAKSGCGSACLSIFGFWTQCA